jgi:alpha-1,4-digalacturonate transport system permease protein
MNAVAFLTNTRGRRSLHWTDWLSYAYLAVGLFLMFGPVLWMVMSSFKTESALTEFPPRFLPYGQKAVAVPGECTASSCPTAARASCPKCAASA